MIKVPINKTIMLITLTKYFICSIKFAGKDILHCVDIFERVFSEGTYYDYFIIDEMYLERNCLIGYSKLEEVMDNDSLHKSNLHILIK